jgi:hypothetical protein
MSRIKALFDAALELGEGEKIVINCTSYKQMESLRASLYRERQKWQQQTKDGSDVGVTRRTDQGKYLLIIERVEPMPDPVIITKDGKIKGIIDMTEAEALVISSLEEASISFSSERSRMIKLMKEDGMTDDEIKAHFAKEDSHESRDVRT